MAGSFGATVASYDMKIKKKLDEITSSEDNIIKQYKILKEFLPKCSESYKKDLILILDERKLYLQYRLQDRERQNDALMKVLDYLNPLEKKTHCKLHIQEIFNKTTLLQNEITMLRSII